MTSDLQKVIQAAKKQFKPREVKISGRVNTVEELEEVIRKGWRNKGTRELWKQRFLPEAKAQAQAKKERAEKRAQQSIVRAKKRAEIEARRKALHAKMRKYPVWKTKLDSAYDKVAMYDGKMFPVINVENEYKKWITEQAKKKTPICAYSEILQKFRLENPDVPYKQAQKQASIIYRQKK